MSFIAESTRWLIIGGTLLMGLVLGWDAIISPWMERRRARARLEAEIAKAQKRSSDL